MLRKALVILELGMVLFIICSFSFAGVPQTINYQGILTGSHGDRITGTISMVFRIYADSSTTTELWSETHDSVDVLNGIFNVLLGSITPIPNEVFDGNMRFLGLTVADDEEMQPRKPLVSVVYAYHSLSAEVADLATSVSTNSVGTEQIIDGTINFVDIGNNGAGPGQLMKWNGTAWVASDDAGGSIYQVTAGAGIAITGDADSFMVSVADNGITSTKLADNSVTTGKIGSAAVDATKLSDGAVTTTKILDAAVTNTKLSTGVVTTDKLAASAVSADKIQSDAVTSDKIVDASILFGDINQNGAGAGQVIKWNGTAWTAGDDASGGTYQVTSGAGIAVTGDADSFMVSVANNGIVSNMLANSSVTSTKIADGAVTNTKLAIDAVSSGNIQTNAVTSDKIVDAAVAAAKLSDDAVTNTKILDGAVTDTKLASDAVSTVKIQANAVTSDKIADASILFGDINQNGAGAGQVIKWNGTAWTAGDDASGGVYQVTAGAGIAVTGGADSFMVSVADNGITTAKLADNSVTSGKIGSAAVDAAKLSDGAVTNTKISDAAVTNTKLSTGVVTADKLATDAVSGDKIQANAVTTDKIQSDAVTSDKIADASILFGDINQNGAGAGQVIKWNGTAWTAGDDASGGTYKVTAGAGIDVTGDADSFMVSVADNGITTAKLADNSVTSGKIGSAAVDATKLSDGAVTNTKILDGAVTSTKLSTGVVTNDKLATSAVSTDKIQSDAVTSDKIADASILFGDINQNGAGSGQVIKWNGTAWTAGDDASGGTYQVTAGAGIAVTGDADSFMVSVTDNGITTAKLADNSITTTKIADGAVTNSKLAIDAISSGNIQTSAVTNDKIADAAVAATKLSDNAVTNTKISDGAVTSTKLSTGVVTNDKLATSAVSADKIQSDAVTSDKIADASILFGDINQNGAGTGQVIKWNGTAWTAGDDASGGTYQVTAGAGIDVTGDADSFMVSVADNGITTAKLADNSVTSGKIGSAAVDATKLSDGAVTNTKISDAAVTNTKLSTGVVTTDKLATDAVSGDKIQANAVTTDKIADATISLSDIGQNGAIIYQVIKWNGTTWAPADDNDSGGGAWVREGNVIKLIESTDSVSIGTTNPAQKLDVDGTVRMTGFQMPTTNAGYVLTSDGSGIGTWQPSGLALPYEGTASTSNPVFKVVNTGTGNGVHIQCNDTTAAAIWGENTTAGVAGLFTGDVNITGTLTKGAGRFKIDHPLDPENKYLYHSFVESPEMMNVYNGNVVMDAKGEAWIYLPEWFEVLNKDFRYQLTCIGGFAPVFVAQEISGNRFKIAGGHEGLKVSWQVTGIRHDPFAQVNAMQVEVDKSPKDKGKYLHPEVYGQGPEKGINYQEHERTELASETKNIK